MYFLLNPVFSKKRRYFHTPGYTATADKKKGRREGAGSGWNIWIKSGSVSGFHFSRNSGI